jgi:replicative DNA helicase
MEIQSDTPIAPPNNLECEQAFLGALLVNNAAYHRVASFLEPEHFYEPVHRRVYAACKTVIDRGGIANPVTLKNLFDQDGALAEIGGAQYLVRLVASVVTIINAVAYANQIHDLYLRRQLIDLNHEIAEMCADHDLDNSAPRIIEHFEGRLFEIDRQAIATNPTISLSDGMKEAIEMAERVFQANGRIIGLPTGLRDLDEKLGGLHAGDLVVIAGRPGQGKSALMANMMFAQASAGHLGHAENLEMANVQMSQRVLAAATGISAERQKQGPINQYDMTQLIEATQKLDGLPLYMNDTPASSVAQIRSRAVQTRMRRGKLACIGIDYLQLLIPKTARNRVEEVSQITRDLKVLAKEMECPVIALSQLSRDVEKRDDKRPQLSDLRESGSIEQDADVVVFCFREETYLGKSYPQQREGESEMKFHQREADWHAHMGRVKGNAELIIAKNRQGRTGTVAVKFDGEKTQFRDVDAALPGVDLRQFKGGDNRPVPPVSAYDEFR